MVQGTTSSAGKSLLVTALCRILHQQGVRVAPFKSQNMALNACVTPDGHEIGRAQAVQAEAAGIAPSADMNPILLKPEGERRSQVVVLGRSIGSLTAADYHAYKPQLRRVIADSLARLRARFEVVIIEGAGSPAEINLRDRDVVNMFVARAADAPVLLVGDIDRGGVFAAFVGTLALLDPGDQPRVAGFIVNKFRGDRGLLDPGLDFLARRTGVPVLGVVPYIPVLRIADEDSLALDDRAGRRRATTGELDIAVVRLPRVSNHDDFAPLEHEPGVVVRFVEDAAALPGADLVVLPGSKSTAADLAWLRAGGMADAIAARAAAGHPVLGICGGCQMLGARIQDPHGVESAEAEVAGLGLLPLITRFQRQKTTAQVRAVARAPWFRPAALADADPGADADAGAEIEGYEIHAGDVVRTEADARPAFEITSRNGEPVRIADGAAHGATVGTLIHGLFENQAPRRALLAHLRARRGLPEPAGAEAALPSRAAEYDRLAAAVKAHVDWAALTALIGR
ncbi:MAG TPA: cobyric acid synthase [Polyangia bacterium]|nr:cobyric acid synthase [Polyangia bacterium]